MEEWEKQEQLERVFDAVRRVEELTEHPALEPDLERAASEFEQHQESIDELTRLIHGDILGPIADAVTLIEEAEIREAVINRAGQEAGDVAAVLYAAGLEDEARGVLRRVLEVVPPGETNAQLMAARQDMKGWTQVVHGRWLMRNGFTKKADQLLKEVFRTSSQAALRKAAKAAADAPRPLDKAPTLATVNGIGTSLYGSRNREDTYNSYVATLCFCVLFIPLWPIRAYRVINQGDGAYTFLAKEKLSKFARMWRLGFVSLIVGLIAWAVVSAQLNAPDRLARIALEELEAEAPEGALAVSEYSKWFDRHAWKAEQAHRERAQLALAEAVCATASVDKLKLDGRAQAEDLLATYRTSAGREAEGAAAAVFVQHGLKWIEAIGSDSPEALRQSLDIAETLGQLRADDARAEIAAVRNTLRRQLAASLAPDWPVEALAKYLEGGETPEALKETGAHILTFGEGPSLYLLADDQVQRWLNAAERHTELAELHGRIKARWSAAKKVEQDEARQAALQSRDEAALKAAMAAVPGDQEVGVALAENLRDRGDVEGALALLKGLGPVGRLTPSAKRVLAGVYADTGKLAEAETLLEGWLAGVTPRFQAARQGYEARLQQVQEDAMNTLRYGRVSYELERIFMSGTDAEKQAAVTEYLTNAIDSDRELVRLRARYEKHGDVVPATLSLGMIKLRRANETSGDARQAKLDEAERAFLSIRHDAEGLPSYHLGLGQVYHRLGRSEEGEAEFARVMANNEPMLHLAVAKAYRELGLTARAKETATKVFESSAGDVRANAAGLLAVMATSTEEEKEWLAKAGSANPDMKTRMLRVEAQELMEQGQLAEADAKFAQVVDAYLAGADNDAVSANNAALAMQSRYLCTGDAKQLVQSVATLEKALKLTPDNALVASNLASVAEFAGMLQVLAKWTDTAVIVPDPREAEDLLGALAEGPMAAKVKAAIAKEPLLRRASDVFRQAEVLAPKSSHAYRRQQHRYYMTGDVTRLERLAERLGRVSLDTSEEDAYRQRYQSGEMDEALMLNTLGDASRLGELAGAAKDKRTQAAAKLLAGTRWLERAWLFGHPQDAEAAIAALSEAAKLWPQSGAAQALPGAYLVHAFLGASEGHEGLKARWKAEGRKYDVLLTLRHALSEDEEGVRTALAAQPSFAKAVAASKASPPADVGLTEWLFAEIAGDQELKTQCQQALSRKDLKVYYRIESQLSTSSAAAKERASIFGS